MRFRLVLAAAVLVPAAAFGWNATGHELVAQIAWNHMNAKARAFCSKLLADNPNLKDNDFLTAAKWADQARTKETGKWHFIDQYWSKDGTKVTDKPDKENVVWALGKFTKILGSKFSSEADRAEALRYVEHFVGDIHQPLHCTSMVDAQFPHGDRGGNSYLLERQKQPGDRWINEIHAFWDNGGGLFTYIPTPIDAAGHAKINSLAARAESELSKEDIKYADSHMDPMDWAKEGLKISETKIYDTPEYQLPDAAYTHRTQQIALKRVAIAGLRLAKILNKLVG